ncbi:MAG: hypothetical protein DWH82_12625 [Planctomycetota bacterium]|nr:MAG: hypothetical protein DWH82_12625 [Planctomycetota bacterium]
MAGGCGRGERAPLKRQGGWLAREEAEGLPRHSQTILLHRKALQQDSRHRQWHPAWGHRASGVRAEGLRVRPQKSAHLDGETILPNCADTRPAPAQ